MASISRVETAVSTHSSRARSFAPSVSIVLLLCSMSNVPDVCSVI